MRRNAPQSKEFENLLEEKLEENKESPPEISGESSVDYQEDLILDHSVQTIELTDPRVDSKDEGVEIMADGGETMEESLYDSSLYSTEMDVHNVNDQEIRTYRIRDEKDQIVSSMTVALSEDRSLDSASEYHISGVEKEDGQYKQDFMNFYSEVRSSDNRTQNLLNEKISGV